MFKNLLEWGRSQTTICRMRIACWIPKATNTHSEYAIFIAFPLQQSLHERASMLLYTYIACLFNIVLHSSANVSPKSHLTSNRIWASGKQNANLQANFVTTALLHGNFQQTLYSFRQALGQPAACSKGTGWFFQVGDIRAHSSCGTLVTASGWTVRGSNSGGGGNFRTCPGVHPASYTMGTGSFPEVKRPGRGVDNPHHLAPRLKKVYSYTSLGLRGLL
jgi:hypothetical protein